MQHNLNEKKMKLGMLAAIIAYLIWGCLPLFWKLASEVPDLEILAHRVIWSFVFMIFLLVCLGKLKSVAIEIRSLFRQPKIVLAVSIATLLITTNWFIFIFAVNSNNIIEASLGYYINPIINVVLATLFLKERLHLGEVLAVITVTIGVIILTWSLGTLPWAAISMAVTFSLYGLVKKIAPVNTWTGLTLETMLMTPFALIFLIYFTSNTMVSYRLDLNLVLICTGVVTAIPLLLFTASAKRISYTMLGFIQYIGPTIMLIIAVTIYEETFNTAQMTAFMFIWIALIIYTATNMSHAAKMKGIGKEA